MDYKDFSSKLEQIFFLRNLKNILYWDSLFSTSLDSQKQRYEEIALLEDSIQKLLRDSELEKFSLSAEDSNLGSWERSNIAAFQDFKINESLPGDLSSKFSKSLSICENLWRSAKQNNDFDLVVPAFQDLFDIVRKIADERANKLGISPYEGLMHKYDPGRSLEEQQNIFSQLKVGIESLISGNNSAINIDPLDHINKNKQILIIKDLIKLLGFNFAHGRVDAGLHPFCGGCPGDTRLIINVSGSFLENLLSAIHETGHGLYEQNLPIKYQNQPVGKARSLMFHEASALFFEMQIARSKSFAIFLAKYLTDKWNIESDPEAIYKKINSINITPIRLRADEVSYHYHVIIRFEIEVELLNGNIKIQDIPKIWSEKYYDYLKIEILNNKEGCLQDMQWFRGMFGYFPSYTNGSIVSSMMFDEMCNNLPYINDEIKNGNFNNISDYLKKSFWSLGSKNNAKQTLFNMTKNSKLDIGSYLRYLNSKYRKTHI